MQKKPVLYIYIFALIWLVSFLAGIRLYDIMDVVTMIIFSTGVSAIVYGGSIMSQKIRGVLTTDTVDENADSPETQNLDSTGNPEVDTLIEEAYGFLREMNNEREKIQNKDFSRKTKEIVDISYKIIKKLRHNPQAIFSAKQFLIHYLPTTTKLITNYGYMESQGISGTNISAAMAKIENSLDTLLDAYRMQLDKLFAEAALDLEVDIDVLENMLKLEGLTNSDADMK